ncbi:MAG TPA: NAD(+) synthetase [Planctomycetes bacterium]|nr:NAD(+) synthetase [Planctomycetota bacterium]
MALQDIPPPPTCNGSLAEAVLTAFLKEETSKAGFSKALLGLSGGVDSALVAELAARALGPENVLGLALPYKDSAPESLQLGKEAAHHAGIPIEILDITAIAKAHASAGAVDKKDQTRFGNILARIRMVALYDRSAKEGALVLGTSNKTELLLGYGTIHGDLASAINPIGDLYKSQVWSLSKHLGVPDEIVRRPPTADLWEGQTDEEELGFTYPEVDALLHLMVDSRYSKKTLLKEGFSEGLIDTVKARVQQNQYKRRPPIIAKLTPRTINLDYRYARDWGS